MKIIYYAVPNFGDKLNELFIKKVFDETPEPLKNFEEADYLGIGSILGHFVNDHIKKDNIVKILGSGFINDVDPKGREFDRELIFVAVRGKLTLEKAEKLVGHKIDCALGDMGIFVDEWFNVNKTKKHKMGIIPHFIDVKTPIILDLPEDILFIDIMGDPQKMIDDICSCEFVLSSSLHGLITCDSLRVPNRHIVLGDKVMGGVFKFKDYYSVYGVYQEPLTQIGTTEYLITDEMIEKYKEPLRIALRNIGGTI